MARKGQQKLDIDTVEQMLDYIEDDPKAYARHTSKKNEFAGWLRDKGLESLANQVEKANREQAIKILEDAVVKHYEQRGSFGKPAFKEPEGLRVDYVSGSAGEFITKEFIIGAIFGFIIALISISIRG